MSQIIETITTLQHAGERVTDVMWPDLWNVLRKPTDLGSSYKVFLTLCDQLSAGSTDDREYVNEQVIRLAARLPDDSKMREVMTNFFVKKLWEDLQHPPMSYLGKKYKYRDPEGRNNNPSYPNLGAAGSYYARSVVPKTLLRRTGAARKHPAQVSSLMFNFATIIIHDCFNTDHNGPKGTTKGSSYADLGPLYGHNKKQQDKVRLKENGKLKNDTFAEWRLVSQPPGVCALMVAFNRFHNYVVEELARINEGGRFNHYVPDPTKSDAEQKDHKQKAEEKRDEDLFQTGRLITSGLYANIILGDYLRTILNLNDNKLKPGSNWTLDPRKYAPNVFNHEGTPRGVGNQVSAEFNFVYRWHATISDRDELWIDGLMKEVFPEEVRNNELPKDFYDRLEPVQFGKHVHDWQKKNVNEEHPEKWTFGHMERDHDGKFPDNKLVRLLTDATNTCAGDFGARNTPVALRVIEMLGIQQGREWGLASLNEFRDFFGLKKFKSFEEINPDPGVSQALKALYCHPDNVELYPGLMSESTKEVLSPGAGLCPGFTISEAILADAVALVRGDRFYTIEYGPQGLTSFGFQELESRDVAGGAQMYKLLMRAFPGWYRSNSVYALYPFTTPQKTMNVFEEIGTPNGIELSDKAPEHFPDPLPGAVHMPQQFNDPWDRLFVDLPPSNTGRHTRSSMPQPTDDQVRRFYEGITRDLIRKRTLKLQEHRYQIDIVQDVGNIAHTVFAAKYFAIPIHDSKDSHTVEKLHEELAHAFEYVFLDFEEAKSYQKRVRAYEGREAIRDKMREVIRSVRYFRANWTSGEPFPEAQLPGFGRKLVARLAERRNEIDVMREIIPAAAAAAVAQSQAWAQMIDYYLLPNNQKQWDKIAKYARSNEPRAFEELKRYFLEGLRLSAREPAGSRFPAEHLDGHGGGPFSNAYNAAGDGGIAHEHPAAHLSTLLDWAEETYLPQGLHPNVLATAGAAMLRTVARECRQIKRATGPQGSVVGKEVAGERMVYLSEDLGRWGALRDHQRVFFDTVAGIRL
ncbi:hypothetical protein SLS58_003085 [Diplodia intermedia]|uniref:Heme peroxidase n=1 Tax=Diplodia intermedia TaxID=856260 RepID=A0ABR3TXQ5_9PEZI